LICYPPLLGDRGPAPGSTLTIWRPAISKEDDEKNRQEQLNHNTDVYWQSRGWDQRPDDWEDRVRDQRTQPDDEE
jgi:hypothetical protein